jgi:DNA-binding beta-propeller fold protein YncE
MCAAFGCFAARQSADTLPGIQIVWPPPPERARIQFVRSIEGNGGLPIVKSRFVRALIGRKEIGLSRPFGIAADGDGRVLLADTDASAVLVYDYPERRLVRVAKFDDRALVSPIGVASGPNRTFYVTDSVLAKVLVFDRDGEFIHEFGAGVSLKRPTGIAIEPGTGRVLVVDSLTGSVFVFSPRGKLLREIGRGELYRPTDVSCNAKGHVFVSDTLNFRIQVYRISDGGFLRTFGVLGDGSGAFRDPRGLAVDRHGNIYVVDRAFSRVQIFDPEGRFLLAFGDPGRGFGQFDMPSDICIAGEDMIYISDSFNGRVQVFRLVGGGK